MPRLQIKLKLFALSGLLVTLLGACQPVKPVEVAAPPREPPTEALRSLCLAWFNSQATWQDEDTERTKDEIDYSYRQQEAVCAPYQKEHPDEL